MTFYAPEPLTADHHTSGFSCGVHSLDTWLQDKARKNAVSGASRTFVVVDDHDVVIAYYALSTGALERGGLPTRLQRNTPSSIPVLVLGRFAVDIRHQGEGVGRSMLMDALIRCERVGIEAGFMFVVVHPVDDVAASFWKRWGFIDAPTTPPALILPLAALRDISVRLAGTQ